MPKISRLNLRQLFSKGVKPLQESFFNWQDSFWHKDDKIDLDAVKGLQTSLDQKLDVGAQDTILDAFNNLITEVTEIVKSGYIDYLKKNDPKPTVQGLYKLIEIGDYTNLTPAVDSNGNPTTIISIDENLNEAYFDGTNWSKITTKLPDNNLKDRILTFNFESNHSTFFKKYIKNIFVQSDYTISKVVYVGINDNINRKLLIMLQASSGDLATFIINADDKRDLKNNIVELLVKEENITFRDSTRVFVEFFDIEFPSSAEVSFLDNINSNILFRPAFDYKLNETYRIVSPFSNDQSVIDFSNLVENIYVVSKLDLTPDNFKFNQVLINQYGGLRKILLFFKHGADNCIFYIQTPINSGSKKVKLTIKEGANDGIDVYLDFRKFDSFPTNEYSISFADQKLELTNESFSNFEINTIYKISELESKNPKTNIVSVSKTQGNNAVQLAIDSIIDASKSNRYQINVANGLYEISRKDDFIGNPGYPAMICPKDHIDIVGQSKSSTILSANFDDSPGEDTWMYQTIYNWANDVKIANLTLLAKNLRYVLHQDNNQETNGVRYYENVDFIFLGNKGGYRALGTGTYSGSKTFVIDGKSQSQMFPTFTVHNNINFDKPSLWSFNNHLFETLNSEKVIEVYNSGSNQDCEVVLENCSFSGGFILSYQEYWLYQQNVNDHFNHANWRVKGSKNTPFYFKNTVIGSTLCIETKSKTKDSRIRFDKASSAYPIIISNTKNGYFGNLGNPNRKIKDDYVIQDGASGGSAFAFGGKSILEKYYFPDNDTWTAQGDSLGKRLGDCTTNNKTLGIIVDGNAYNIVFNKNYTAFTNAQVIAEINTVISAVATAKEYNIGTDYYAEMTDVVSIEINSSTTTIIPKGTLVSKVGANVKICEEGEVLYGLAIDDIAPYELDSSGVIVSKGRIIKNCYVSLDIGNISSAKFSGTGARFKIVNGVFTADVNGYFKIFTGKYIKI